MIQSAIPSRTADILVQAMEGVRLSEADALHLFEHAELSDLGLAAQSVRNRLNDPRQVSYVVDRNVNYTNICNVKCSFCAFHRQPADPGAYLLSKDELREKALETLAVGGTGFLLQGGVNPDLPWSYYLDLVDFLHHDLGLWVHGFSPVEIQWMARLNGQGLRKTLEALRSAGLGSLPGGGAEILVDRVRKKISPRKGEVRAWLEVMEVAHEVGPGQPERLGRAPHRLRRLALPERSYPLGREAPQADGGRILENDRHCKDLP